jgi:hypothetical protein
MFVRPSACISSASIGYIFVKFYISGSYENLCRKSKCGYNRTKISATLLEDVSNFYCCKDITSSFKHYCRRRVVQQCKTNVSLCFHISVFITDYIVDITSLVRKDSVCILQKTPFTHDVFVRYSMSGTNWFFICNDRTRSIYVYI